MDTKKKIFILSENLTYLKNKWICDVFKEEFESYVTSNKDCAYEIVDKPEDSDIIWLLASWYVKKIPVQILKSKYVISTIHHIDKTKYNENKKMYQQIDDVTNRYHVICQSVYDDLRELTTKEIVCKNFWINEKNYFHIDEKESLRQKYGIPLDKYVVGSFQRDSEGADLAIPKLSKGPDLLVKILDDMKLKGTDLFVVLSGWRRTYIINELTKLGIPYVYNELVDITEINELYNCLDLYVVSSRVEGAPRSIVECGLAQTPIISTDVGIATLILDKASIYDVTNCLSYTNAKPNVIFAYESTQKYVIENYMNEFIDGIFKM